MATQNMLKFVSTPREMPEKRPGPQRIQDFHEVYQEFAAAKAAEQAGRCSQCGVPYCQTHCPLHNNIPDWLRLTAEGRLQEAYLLSQSTNNFPEICGRICPQDRLCEGNCVIEQSGHGTVTIGAIEKYLTETAWREGWVQQAAPVRDRAETVGIIGAGPAGLAAADMLRQEGFQVSIYDRYDRAGGLLTYGIPGFKLDKQAVARRIRLLEQAGIRFVANCEIGRDIGLDALRERHDAVLIATGVYRPRALGGDMGALPALDYLSAANRVELGDHSAPPDGLDARGKRVIVIGGGDTAMDCLRTAIRQGARSVRCLYRRDRDNMPGSQRETRNAEEEGVHFDWLSAPIARDPAGLVVQRMRLAAPDSSGRRSPLPIEGATHQEPCDMVIAALGFDAEDLPALWSAPGLEVTPWGTVKADFRSHHTSIPGVFAAGDIQRGASLVVWAIRDGREAARSIAEFLNSAANIAAQ